MARRGKSVEIEGLAIEELISRVEIGEPVILNRGGSPVAAIMTIDALRTLIEERELLRRLALGELESAAGEGDELEAVLQDCGLLLEEN